MLGRARVSIVGSTSSAPIHVLALIHALVIRAVSSGIDHRLCDRRVYVFSTGLLGYAFLVVLLLFLLFLFLSH